MIQKMITITASNFNEFEKRLEENGLSCYAETDGDAVTRISIYKLTPSEKIKLFSISAMTFYSISIKIPE